VIDVYVSAGPGEVAALDVYVSAVLCPVAALDVYVSAVLCPVAALDVYVSAVAARSRRSPRSCFPGSPRGEKSGTLR
jgi:hypothetical protein